MRKTVSFGGFLMAEHNCEQCGFRAKYDKNPKSFSGKMWRWHINWCPGWKGYMKSIPDDKRNELAEQYGLCKNKYS